MFLSQQEKDILKNKEDTILARYMNILVRWGEAMGAARMVPVNNVHAVLCSKGNYLKKASQTTIDREIYHLKEVCSRKVRCFTTTHASYMDLRIWRELGINEKQAGLQHKLLDWGRKAGFLMTWTCAPYLVGNVPTKGEICAWTESSAVVYANSIIGARTTRHGDVSALAAAMLGIVPKFGVLLKENRKGDFVVDVQVKLSTYSDWGALGYYIGKVAGLRIPVFRGVESITLEDAKQLSAALASSGGVTMFHIVGLTPEAATLENAFQSSRADKVIRFDNQDLRNTYQIFNTRVSGYQIDNVVLGCPHASLKELKQIAELLEGKKVSRNLNLWICTAYGVAMDAKRSGYLKIIEDAGGKVLCDTCLVNCRPSLFMQGKRMATNAFKQAHYAQNFGMEVFMTNVQHCIDIAIKGAIGRNSVFLLDSGDKNGG